MGPRRATKASRGLNKVSKKPSRASRGRGTHISAELENTQNAAESQQGDVSEIPNLEDEIAEEKESHQEILNEIPHSEDTQNETLEQRVTRVVMASIQKELRQTSSTRVLQQEEYADAGEYSSRSPLYVY